MASGRFAANDRDCAAWPGAQDRNCSFGASCRTSSLRKESDMRRVFLVMGMVAVSTTGLPAAAADGKAVYEKTCKGCHSAMPPKFGDKAAWAPLIKRGASDLTASVVKGKGAMPPKGGAASDEDVKAAVDYMIDQAK